MSQRQPSRLPVTAALLLAAGTLYLPGAYAANGGNVLEEVIVTATKRSESLQDVPISIAVVSGETIDNLNIKDVSDLQSYVPGLTVQTTFGNWAIRIRGLGSGVTNLAFDSSVSIFNDGVYCGRSRCLEAGFLDPARVEVARGPQGALFGKSTIAGAISVLSAQPTDEFEGYIRAGYEAENGGYTLRGMVSGPLTDRVRGRFAFKKEELDGFIKNPITGMDEPETDNYALRALLAWDVSDNVSTTFKYERSDSRIDGRTNQLVSSGLFGGITGDADAEFKRDKIRRVSTGTDEQDFDDAQSDSFTLTMDAALGEHTLTAIANYWGLEYENYLDVSGVPELFLNTSLSEDYNQKSLELRLLSPVGQTFEYIVGGLYLSTDTKTRQYSPFGFFPAVGVPGFLVPNPVGGDRQFQRDSDTFSVYGQLTWNATDRLKVILDLRYTEEDQKGVGHAFPVVFLDGRNPTYEPTAFNQPPEYMFTEKRTDDSLDPSIRAQYELNDSISFYVAYAEGSKPGGLKANDGGLGAQLLEKDAAFLQEFVGQAVVTPQNMIDGLTLKEGNGVFDFEDEKAKNFEVGTKMLILDGAATINIALFNMQFDNLQTSSYDGTRFIIGNAASAEIQGLEFEGVWQATGNLRLSASLALLDATYDKYLGAQCVVIDEDGTFRDPTCVDGEEDLSGEKLERTPDWEMNLNANWEKQISDAIVVSAMVSIYHSDDYSVRQDFHPLGVQDAYTKWDLRLALFSPSDTWEVAFVGRNLTDKMVLQHAYEIAGSNFVSFSRGRTLTFEALMRF